MKILYVTTVSNTVNAFLVPHIKMLIREGHQVEVAFNIEQEVSKELLGLNCKVHKIPFSRSPLSKANLAAFKLLNKLIASEKYDLVHTHTPVASAITRIVCRKFKSIKLLYTAHGFHFFKGASIKNWIVYYSVEKLLINWTDLIITMNSEDYINALKLSSGKKCKVHYVSGVGIDLLRFNCVDAYKKDSLRKAFGYSTSDFVIIYVGELSKRKNQKQIIQAVKYLHDYKVQCRLLLVGDGNMRVECEEKAKSLGIKDKVDFLGFRKDIPNLFAMSDVAISSSMQEGLPVNIMEAMAVGLPLVVTNCRGNIDLVTDEVNGYIVNINSSIEMAGALKKLYDSHENRNRFGKNNKEIIKKYSELNVLDEMNKIYQNYLEN